MTDGDQSTLVPPFSSSPTQGAPPVLHPVTPCKLRMEILSASAGMGLIHLGAEERLVAAPRSMIDVFVPRAR